MRERHVTHTMHRALPTTAAPATDGSTVPPRRCLVADDEPRLRQVLCRLMTAEGYECLEAGSGAEALAALADTSVPLVLTDLRMPQMDGLELLRELGQRHPDTAVLMITGIADVDVAVRALGLGATDYITKPFHLEEVRVRVAQAVEKQRLRLENREHSVRLEERVAAQARRLEELFLAAIQSLVDALEVKDPYTRGHSDRVSRYGASIARALGLDDELVRQVELGGHLHDIGKIGVREAVLNKPGALTDEEYLHIMTHPMVGWQILSPLLGDAPAALRVVRWHHERFDGQGTPDRLGGEEIPVEARVTAVADAFDAMTSSRPYRAGRHMTPDAALEELGRHRGTQFDPDVLDVFTGLVRDGAVPVLGADGADATPAR